MVRLMLSSKHTSWNLEVRNPKNLIAMSKAKKELRAAKKAKREELQTKRIMNWIIWSLFALFVVIFIAYAFLA